MRVKTIFKILIGTIVVMAVSFVFIELYNITLNTQQLNRVFKISAKQACDLVAQETYKIRLDSQGRGSGSIDMADFVGNDGILYVEGKFYEYTDPERIYESIYGGNEFKNWMKTQAVQKGNWKSLKLIDRAINNVGSLNVSIPDASLPRAEYNVKLAEYNDAMLAKTYKNVLMTPLNMGVPYLDKEVLNRIFKWNTAMLVSGYNKDTIKTDASGEKYIAYSGFRVYANKAKVISLDYRTFDLTVDSERAEFNYYTNIDPDNLGFEFNERYLGKAEDERKRVCLVGVNYSVPVAYEGITPIKRLFNFVWEKEVNGLGASARGSKLTWNDTTKDFSAGGFDGSGTSVSGLSVPGILIYYVIR